MASPSIVGRVVTTQAGGGGPSACEPRQRLALRTVPPARADLDRPRDEQCKLAVARADRSPAERGEPVGDLPVPGRGREQQLLHRVEPAAGRVVRGHQEMAEQTSPVALSVAVDRGVELIVGRRAAIECRRQLIGQPLGRLERPPAADAPNRVGRHRRVADEREPGAASPPGRVRHLELAEDLRDPLAARQIGRVRETAEVRLEVRLEIALEPRLTVLGLERRHQRDPVVLRKRVGDVGVEQPHHHRVAGHERQVSVVREIAEATVPHDPGLRRGQLADPRIPAVGGDDDPRRDVALAPLAVDRPHARRPAARAEQGVHGLSQHHLDPGSLGRQLAHHRVELLAPDVVAVAGIGELFAQRGTDPSVPSPERHAVANATGGLDPLGQPEPLDRRRCARRDEVGAHRLVGGGIRARLHQSDARPCPPEQCRRRTPGQARAHHHHVVISRHGSTP